MAKNAEDVLRDSSGPRFKAKVPAAPQAKVSQDEASYRPADGEDKCAECTFFVPGKQMGTCKQVSGAIDPTYVCDLFQNAMPDVGDEMFGES